MFGDTHFSFRPLKDPLVEQLQKENKELKDKIASLKEKFDSELRSRSQTLKLQSSFEKFDSQHKVWLFRREEEIEINVFFLIE